MNTVRQSMRPKHQVLVLKCYPRLQKNVADVKPNSSELSYLLYYASTRRSKVQKVGSFLEKRTARDVAKGRTGNVQVTLQILRALIDKSPRDLQLYAPHVLRILIAVLDARDLATVEYSVSTFQTFCEHQDTATFAADQELIGQYAQVVTHYAQFASDAPIPSRVPLSAPAKIGWRTAGLQAIKSITGSEAIAANGGKQIPLLVATVSENLYRHSEGQLLSLSQRANADRDTAIRRRMSIATVRTSESVPAAGVPAPTTTADADRLAEEEVGLLALQSMRQLFTANNRSQIRLATTSLLQFLMEKPLEYRPETAKSSTRSGRTGYWATTVVEMVTQVTPVQDRFIIVVTAVETLIRSPTSEEDLEKQLVLATLIECLLGSSINMIGLSIMDVLLGLIQHILLLLQLGGKGTQILPHHQQAEALDPFSSNDENITAPLADDQQLANVHRSSTLTAKRQELLVLLKRCIANLATHVYYSDQISDIETAILSRLKPASNFPIASAVAAIERPDAAAQSIADSINIKEDQSTDEFFSFATARVTALDAVKEVLLTANKRGAFVGAGAIGRNKVSIGPWEGTQWLLRDEDRRVRYAYVEALLTWLRLETTRADLRVSEGRSTHRQPKTNGAAEKPMQVAAWASSSASPTGRPKHSKSNFLQLLHLAVYDNALDGPESQPDTLLSHTLLVALVDRLGLNAVQYGLPMILRLQDDAASDAIPTARGKVNVRSLVHGYLLYLSQRLEFDTTMVGHDIQTEISRRRKAGTWLDSIQIPTMPVEQIASLPVHSEIGETRDASLNPFTNIPSMVDQIVLSYSSAILSPPSSPLASPSKASVLPTVSVPVSRPPPTELPQFVRERLVSTWTKELCIAAVEKESTRTASPRGSRTGTSNSGPNGLLAPNGNATREPSPGMGVAQPRTRDGTGPSLPNLQTAQRRTSNPQGSGPPTPISSNDQSYTLRVDDMKRVLAGGSLGEAFTLRQRQPSLRAGSPLRNSSTAQHDFATKAGSGRRLRGPSLLSVGSDSIVDAEGFESASEGDVERPLPSLQAAPSSAEVAPPSFQQLESRSLEPASRPVEAPLDDSRPSTGRGRARSASQTSAEDPRANAKALKGELDPDVVRGSIVTHEGVPPVPPLPEGLAARSSNPGGNTSEAGKALRSDSVRGYSRGRASEGRGTRARASGERRVMVQALLGSIEVSSDASKSIGLPPY